MQCDPFDKSLLFVSFWQNLSQTVETDDTEHKLMEMVWSSGARFIGTGTFLNTFGITHLEDIQWHRHI